MACDEWLVSSIRSSGDLCKVIEKIKREDKERGCFP